MSEQKKTKIFVLDTSVLMHDKNAPEAFGDNIVIIPLIVLSELDGLKNSSSKGESAKAVIQCLNELIGDNDPTLGIPTPKGGILKIDPDGEFLENTLPKGFDPKKPDNIIILTAKEIAKKNKNAEVILVSKDISMRIIAKGQKVKAQDYRTSKIPGNIAKETSIIDIDVPDNVFSIAFDPDHNNMITLGEANISSDVASALLPNACLRLNNDAHDKYILAIYNKKDGLLRKILKPQNYIDRGKGKDRVEQIHPRNDEQAFAYEFIHDPDISIITISGTAGTGKSLMAMLAGWDIMNRHKRNIERNIENKVIPEAEMNMIIFRPTVEVGPEVGFLPGTMEEKIAPWAEPALICLQLIFSKDKTVSLNSQTGNGRIRILSATHVRGATFNDTVIVLDDVQNYKPEVVKTLVTRAGQGSKVILTGDPTQVDDKYLDENSNGFVHVISRFRGRGIHAHVNLITGERSELAELAAEIL
ncbi:MAG: PhoH family protein [Candidatus Paceibacterota bacterium]|jgi:PhoH-like ATPase